MIPRALASLVLLLCVAPAAAQGSPCSPQGLNLTVGGGRISDPITVVLHGTATMSGVLGIDFGGGPVGTVWGPVCLDLSPAMIVVPVTLDGFGTTSFELLVPPNPALAGVTTWYQSFVFDVLQPSGLAFSNGAEVTFFSPRLFLLEASTSPFGVVAGTLLIMDALTGNVNHTIPLAAAGLDLLWLDGIDQIAVLLENGEVVFYDGDTGAEVSSVTLPATPENPVRLYATDVEGEVLAVHLGQLPSFVGFGGTPGGLTRFDVVAGTIDPAIAIARGNPVGLIQVPGSTLVYLYGTQHVVGVDYVAATQLPFVEFNTDQKIVDALLDGNRLICLFEGKAGLIAGTVTQAASIAEVDTVSGIPPSYDPVVIPTPVGPALATQIRKGPGLLPGGNYYVLYPAFAELAVLDPADLSLMASQIPPAGAVAMELSPNGTEWMILSSGSATTSGTLSLLDPSTLMLTPLPLPQEEHTTLTLLRSASLLQAYVTGPGTLYAFTTDPGVGPVWQSSFPVSTEITKAVTD